MTTKEEQIYEKALKTKQAIELGEFVDRELNNEIINDVIETSKILWRADYPEGSRGYNLKQSNQFIIYVQKQLGAGKHEFELFNELIEIQ